MKNRIRSNKVLLAVLILGIGSGLWAQAGAYNSAGLAPIFIVDTGGATLALLDVPGGKTIYKVKNGELVYGLYVTKDTVTLDGRSDRWVKVEPVNGGTSGWVFGGYLRAERAEKYPGLSALAETSTSSEAPAGMVYVAAGTFQMGGSGEYDGKPIHSVSLTKAYYISDHEVTQAEWHAVMGTDPSYFTGDNKPVEQVSWYEAVEYCNKKSIMDGRTPAYVIKDNEVTWNKNANGYRLPTEAEWEYAARGGNKSKGYTYAGSNAVDEVAWYRDNSERTLHSVKTKAPNELGIYDMSGNVWEWCWDWWGDYSSSATTDPIGAETGSGRIGRGASWYDLPTGLQPTYRSSISPADKNEGIGFRVVCF